MKTGYSTRYNLALGLAARAHAGQRRKGKDVPYIAHPVHVSRILEKHGCNEDVVLAGLLHDTLEDTSVTERELLDAVGAEVVSLVRAVTETKRDDHGERSWEVRKAEQLEHLARCGADVAALKAADALHNVNETLEDVHTNGAAVAFSRFKRGPGPSIGYYRDVARIVREQLGDAHPLFTELAHAIDALARAVEPANENELDALKASGG